MFQFVQLWSPSIWHFGFFLSKKIWAKFGATGSHDRLLIFKIKNLYLQVCCFFIICICRCHNKTLLVFQFVQLWSPSIWHFGFLLSKKIWAKFGATSSHDKVFIFKIKKLQNGLSFLALWSKAAVSFLSAFNGLTSPSKQDGHSPIIRAVGRSENPEGR